MNYYRRHTRLDADSSTDARWPGSTSVSGAGGLTPGLPGGPVWRKVAVTSTSDVSTSISSAAGAGAAGVGAAAPAASPVLRLSFEARARLSRAILFAFAVRGVVTGARAAWPACV